MKVYEIDPENFGKYKEDFKNIIRKPNMCGVFSKSCGHCEMMKPAWNQLKSKVAGIPGMGSLIEIDSQVLPQLEYEPLQNKVSGYPTILIIKRGIPKMEYSGNRSFEDMFSYFNKHMQAQKESMNPPNKLITLRLSSPSSESPTELYEDAPKEKLTRKRKRANTRYQSGGSKKKHHKSKCCKKKNNSKCICNKTCLPQCPCCNPKKKKKTLRKKQKRYRHKHHKH